MEGELERPFTAPALGTTMRRKGDLNASLLASSTRLQAPEANDEVQLSLEGSVIASETAEVWGCDGGA